MEKYLEECCEYFKERYKKNFNINQYSDPVSNYYSFDLDTKVLSKDKDDCIDFYLDIAVKFYDYLKVYELSFIRDDYDFDIEIDFSKDKEDNLKEIEIRRKILKGMNVNFIPFDYLNIHLRDEYKEFIELYSGKCHFTDYISGYDSKIWDGESGIYDVNFWLTYLGKIKKEGYYR